MNIPEIRDTVLNFLEPPDLASCARTCRLWSIPALRPLWRDVRKWRPLFAILGELKSEGETQQVSFVRTPTFENWGRFHMYASLIKAASMGIDEHRSLEDDQLRDDVHPRALQQVHMLAEANNVHVLPSLRSLYIVPYNTHCAEMTSRLVVDTLQSLELDWDSPLCDWVAVLPVLKKTQGCRNLRKLQMSLSGDFVESSVLQQAVVDVLGCQKHLSSLEIPSALMFQPLLWHAIADHCSLTSLCCYDMEKESTFAGGLGKDIRLGGQFSQLKDLACSMTVDSALSLLGAGTNPSLIDTLNLTIFDGVASDSILRLTSCISVSCPKLKHLDLLFVRNMHPITIRDMLPLTRLRGLNGLSIQNDTPAGLSDEDYASFAQAMPLIRHLIISPDPVHVTDSPATLLAVFHIARHCRQLRGLALFIDLSTASLPPSASEVVPFSSALVQLSFGLSKPESYLRVAIWVKCLLMSNPRAYLFVPRNPETRPGGPSKRAYGRAYERCQGLKDALDDLEPLICTRIGKGDQ